MTLGDKIFNWVKVQNTNDYYPTMSDIQSQFAPRNIYGNIVGIEQSYCDYAVYLKNNRNHKKVMRVYIFFMIKIKMVMLLINKQVLLLSY